MTKWLNLKVCGAIDENDLISLKAHIIVFLDLKISQIKANPPSQWASQNQDYLSDLDSTKTIGRKKLIDHLNCETDIQKLSELFNQINNDVEGVLYNYRIKLSNQATSDLKSLFPHLEQK